MSAAIWVNGVKQGGAGPHISAQDRGLTVGDGVFETMRTRRGTIFRLDQHLARLGYGLDRLQIPAPPSLRDWVCAAARETELDEAGLRLTVTRGPAAVGGVVPPAHPVPTVIVTVSPMPPFQPSIYERGLSAHVASGRRNEFAMSAGLKTLGYADAVLALLEARRAGADEALFLDTEGHCAEATSSNLFIWTGAALWTPPVTCGVLPGVTRAAVIEVARGQGLAVEERAFGLDSLHAAAEAFLTSSLRAVVPLVRVGARPIGSGAPGALTRRVGAAYLELVARECGA